MGSSTSTLSTTLATPVSRSSYTILSEHQEQQWKKQQQQIEQEQKQKQQQILEQQQNQQKQSGGGGSDFVSLCHPQYKTKHSLDNEQVSKVYQ